MPRYLFTYPKEDNDFRPNQRLPKQLKMIKKLKETKVFNRNGWDEDENRKYRQFLELNTDLLNNREQRRQKKVFLRLSQHVQTRDANQCRSHHQKMIQKYKSIERILEFLRYLQERGVQIEKDESTYQPSPKLQGRNEQDSFEEIDAMIEMERKDSIMQELIQRNPDQYLSFLEDDIWEL